MEIIIEITEEEIKNLKLIRNYFGEHDKTMLEHMAYNELDRLVKKLQQAHVSSLVCDFCEDNFRVQKHEICERCRKVLGD